MLLFAPVDRPTVSEAVDVARSLEPHGCGLSAGEYLVSVHGVGAIAALASFGPVFADVRLSGGEGVAAVARRLAAGGATRVSIDGRVSRHVIEAAVSAVRPHGATIVVVPLPPEADAAAVDTATIGAGRGKAVSRCAAALAGLDVEILGLAADAGVVSQVAPRLALVAWGLSTPADVAEAAGRGAAAGVLASALVSDRDPAGSLGPLAEAAAAG